MLKKTISLTVLSLALGVSLSSCESTRASLGLDKVKPDEYRIVTKAPLVVPPDFSLRPPAPGKPRPQELQPDEAARSALLGQRDAINRSSGEVILAQKIGADRADPLARFVVDDDYGDLAHKDESFADKVLFWKKPQDAGQVAQQSIVANEVAPVDAAAELKTLEKLTGNKAVVIQQKREVRIKLPGL